ncbi:hypothetical protein MKX01_026941 [Papaver californicum]|nr:hypothetical protein MKX01_026941 [Papaver californicum]
MECMVDGASCVQRLITPKKKRKEKSSSKSTPPGASSSKSTYVVSSKKKASKSTSTPSISTAADVVAKRKVSAPSTSYAVPTGPLTQNFNATVIHNHQTITINEPPTKRQRKPNSKYH